MSNNKQSSVKWAIEKITMICALYNRKEMSLETFEYYHRDIVQKAKAWHKDEIEQAFDKGGEIGVDIGSNHDWHEGHNQGHQYYNETFGGEQ